MHNRPTEGILASKKSHLQDARDRSLGFRRAPGQHEGMRTADMLMLNVEDTASRCIKVKAKAKVKVEVDGANLLLPLLAPARSGQKPGAKSLVVIVATDSSASTGGHTV